jgi:hypothetical protein
MELSESVALLDFTDGFAARDVRRMSPRMTALAAITIARAADMVHGSRWIVSTIVDESRRVYYCRYHLLLAGYVLTNPVLAPRSSALVGIAETLRGAEDYIQFKEPFEMLGEVNGRLTVLDSFLSSYHVLENYMIRAQIVKVESSTSAQSLFGIRNFKQMELTVQKREQEHLTQLFKQSWDKQIGSMSLADFVEDRFRSLFDSDDCVDASFQDFIRKLNIKSADETFSRTDIVAARNALPKIIYQVRCSIVHNKETEFHLSNRELSDATLLMMLVDVCIPSMQRIAFGLPAVSVSNPLRYSRQSLLLY